MRVLIVGCGYVGAALGAELARQGNEVVGLCRTGTRDQELRSMGLKPVHADITNAADLRRIPGAFDWVVNCVSTRGGDAAAYRRTYLDGMRNLLAWLGDALPRRFVYTSSTSVYGQSDGSEVDESSPTEPETETGRVLLETERAVLEAAHARGVAGVVLRLSGIYGPGRGYWLQRALRGDWPPEAERGRIVNQIHRDDVVGCIQVALQRGKPGTIYNATDDGPVSLEDMLAWLADKLGRAAPPKNATVAELAATRGAGGKRVSNRKLKAELGYRCIYPSFREGYGAELTRRGP